MVHSPDMRVKPPGNMTPAGAGEPLSTVPFMLVLWVLMPAETCQQVAGLLFCRCMATALEEGAEETGRGCALMPLGRLATVKVGFMSWEWEDGGRRRTI